MSITTEFEKIIHILTGSEFEGCFNPPATQEQISELETITGIPIAGGLRELWLLTNGAQYRKYGTPAFGVYTNGAIPCDFLSIQESIKAWRDVQWEEDFDGYQQESPRDPRIKTGWSNSRWLPFAQFNGYGTVVYYDLDPGIDGQVGQIIAYQHDPDAIYLVANSFNEFFKMSNQLLVTNTSLVSWINGK